jgi:hypothetical protein
LQAEEKYESQAAAFVSDMASFEIKMEELYDAWIARISVEEKAFYLKSYELYSQREIKLKASLKGTECSLVLFFSCFVL